MMNEFDQAKLLVVVEKILERMVAEVEFEQRPRDQVKALRELKEMLDTISFMRMKYSDK